jgi:predicted ATPase
MIKRIMIKNFKCIKELSIDLAPLTIFVGPNGSGKSTILEALALMSQCSKKNVSVRSETAIKGELLEYDEVKSILHRGLDEVELGLGITTDIQIEEIKGGVQADLKDLSAQAHLPTAQQVKEHLSAYLDFLRKLELDGKRSVEVSYLYLQSNSYYSHNFTIDGHTITVKYDVAKQEYVSEPKCQLRAPAVFLPTTDVFVAFSYSTTFCRKLAEALKSRLSKVYYLSTERGSIPWRYEAKGEKHRWVGRGGEHTLEVLAELMKPEHDEKRLPYEILCKKLEVEDVWVGWDYYNYLTSNYRDPYLNSTHKFPSLGYGSRQLLTVIAQLAYSEPDSIILVEEPEISLHPKLQRFLPVIFGRAVNEGKQILVSTHSSYFPLSLDLVLEGFPLEGQTTRGQRKYEVKLSPNDIIVYHVYRDEREGCTRVEKLALDEGGLKEGIPSFIDVEREIFEKFISRE